MTTEAPAAIQACACDFCFNGSLSAFVIMYVTPAFLSAFAMSGASNCTQRTDDFVSGSRTQTCALAAFWLREADAMAVRRSPAITAARPTATTLRETSFTDVLLSSTEPVLSRLTHPSPQAEESLEERRGICGLRQVTAVSGRACQSQRFVG